ncbi:hypothetical protein D8S78_00755 [Natrialba swarupiae]|nr:hypothetical protein [Natrialba swarupiae]
MTPAQIRDRDPESLLASAKAGRMALFWQFRENVCDECGGAIDLEFHDRDAGSVLEWSVRGRCRQCWRVVHGPPSIWLATHPRRWAFTGTTGSTSARSAFAT